MKLTNLKIIDIINTEKKFSFLIGAGCSIDPPSCLPSGYEIMDSIINYAYPASEIKKFQKLKT